MIVDFILFALALVLAISYNRWFVHVYKTGKEEPGKTLMFGWGCWFALSIVSNLALFNSNKTMALIGLVILYAPPLVLGTVAGSAIIASYVGMDPEKHMTLSVLTIGGLVLLGTAFVPVVALAYKGMYYFGLGAVFLSLQSPMPDEAPVALQLDDTGRPPVRLPGWDRSEAFSEPSPLNSNLKLVLLVPGALLACGLFGFFVFPFPQLALARAEKGCAAGIAERCGAAGALQVKKDKALAAQYFRKACDMKDEPACSAAGKLKGEGFSGYVAVPPSAAENNCQNGDADACATAGMEYLKGTGREKDAMKARDLLRKACDGNSYAGCHVLGWVFSKGDEFHQPDPKFAAGLYKKACEGGYAPSCYNLALAYRQGNGVERDVSAALELAEEACAKKNQQACQLAQSLGSR